MILKRWGLITLFLVLVTLSYRALFLVYHHDILGQQSLVQQFYALFWGTRFDIAIAMPMALLSIVLHRLMSYIHNTSWHLYTLPWIPVIYLIQTGDTLYFQDSGRHISYEILSAQGDGIELIKHALHAGFGHIIVSTVILIFFTTVWIKYSRQIFVTPIAHPLFATPIDESLSKKILLSLILLLSTVIGMRGGISGVPQSPIHAYKIGNANLAIIASNPVYIAFSTLTSSEAGITQIKLPKSSLSSEDMFRQLYPEPINIESNPPVKLNVILIFLESWNAAFMQSYNPNEPLNITPNFDVFREKALSSDLTLAGGHRTVEGVFSAMCSFQNPLGTSIAKSQLLNLPYSCLPEMLSQQGYATSFIQGSYRDTGSVGSFAQRLGFQESLGKVELPKGKIPHNVWGLQDDDLYETVLNKAELQQQPFFYAINTTSTHDTVIPPLSTPLLDAKTNEEKHKNVMHYADEAFGRFLNRFNNSPLAENTILVAMADHTAQVHSNYLHEYMIPLAIKAPGMGKKHIPFATTQRDLAPTLLEMLQLPPSSSFAGKSLISSDVFYADYYHNQHLGWIEHDLLLDINLLNGETRCYKWREDLNMKNTVPCDSGQQTKQRALATTALMQNHLFSGTTKEFIKHTP
jgi:phosphoglycerol transferase MdoB-like AlkP superfamily enzyme